MQFPGFELMAAEVADGLESGVQRGLSGGLAHFVPRRSGMEHLDGGIASFFRRLDLFRVLIAVTNFQREGVVTNVTFDVDAEVNFHTVSFLQHHVAVPTFNALDLVVGGEMSSQIIHGYGSGKGRFSTVPMNKAFSRFNDLVEGLSRLKFILHGLEGSAGNMACISPILQVGFFHH